MRWMTLLLTVLLIAGPTYPIAAQTGIAPQTPSAEAYIAEGNQHAQARQYDRAVEAYRQALRLNPESAAAHHGLGSVYINMGRAPEAVEPLRTAARLAPQNAATRLNLGIALALLRRADEALAELNEARRLSPQDPRIHNEIGNTLHNSFGRIEEALAAYQEARRLNPNVPAVHHNIGLMLMRLGRFGEAVAPLEEALRLNPAYRSARFHLSNAYSRLGRYAEAVESWTKLLQLDPSARAPLSSRAWGYMYLGGHGTQAAADARRFLQVAGWRDESSQFMVLLAHLGERLAGQEEQARSILEEAARRGDTGAWPYPIIRYMRGELTAEELLRLAADNGQKTEARTYIGMDLLLKGKGQEAREHFLWVKEYGDRRFLEYPLAVAELSRMEQ